MQTTSRTNRQERQPSQSEHCSRVPVRGSFSKPHKKPSDQKKEKGGAKKEMTGKICNLPLPVCLPFQKDERAQNASSQRLTECNAHTHPVPANPPQEGSGAATVARRQEFVFFPPSPRDKSRRLPINTGRESCPLRGATGRRRAAAANTANGARRRERCVTLTLSSAPRSKRRTCLP